MTAADVVAADAGAHPGGRVVRTHLGGPGSLPAVQDAGTRAAHRGPPRQGQRGRTDLRGGEGSAAGRAHRRSGPEVRGFRGGGEPVAGRTFGPFPRPGPAPSPSRDARQPRDATERPLGPVRGLHDGGQPAACSASAAGGSGPQRVGPGGGARRRESDGELRAPARRSTGDGGAGGVDVPVGGSAVQERRKTNAEWLWQRGELRVP